MKKLILSLVLLSMKVFAFAMGSPAGAAPSSGAGVAAFFLPFIAIIAVFI